MDKEREAFEAYIRSRNPDADLEKTAVGNYCVRHIDFEWNGWQARAMLEYRQKEQF